MTDAIPEVDRERIEAMVQQYRHQIESLYRMARMQGQLEEAVATTAKLRQRMAESIAA